MKVEKPSNYQKKLEMNKRLEENIKKQREANRKHAEEMNKYYLEQGKKYHEEYIQKDLDVVNKKREAKANCSIYVEEEPKFLLVVRTKGINKMDPKSRKIMVLLRLRQINNAVFLKNNKAIMNMLIKVQPYIMWGYASRSTIHELIYKRGYGKVNGQRIPLTNNRIIEEVLGKYGIKCMEDLKHEILTVGKHFKEANNFLWPFKLRNPKGGYKAKNHPYLQGGSHGDRAHNINGIVKAML